MLHLYTTWEKIEILKVIWSIAVSDNEQDLFRALNWLSVNPSNGKVNVTSVIYSPAAL